MVHTKRYFSKVWRKH